jgi:23S rRNA pseudouridine1911/1915/1917 synthase
LVVNKPALLPTMGVSAGRPSLLSVAKQYIQSKYNKPGNVYLGIVSRLDAPVTGVVLIARTSKAAKRLSEAFRKREVEKFYWGVVEGVPDAMHGSLEHYLRKDQRHRRVHATHENCPGAQVARLQYSVLRTAGNYSLLCVQLETGRKHQIRVQLAKIGHPILGDRKYGSEVNFPSGIALHAKQLKLQHPVRDEFMEFEARLPACWRKEKIVSQLL